jgi:hypothetical protein
LLSNRHCFPVYQIRSYIRFLANAIFGAKVHRFC